ncbi:hypothetical protein GCM10023193_38900 [Planotetraspora kaengkrachanensis]|uniref:Uncharacterized protein n=1 Tax=Planotetraspora kaengkrachanensis TaxID=575193 RepID=A0A8J3M4K3_9ACTN|nr:hypothetical protein Pka01_22620 [Planotetraspora kaengkrachanensis]
MTADAREPHRDEGADLLQALDAADKKEPAQHAKETSRRLNPARTATPMRPTPRLLRHRRLSRTRICGQIGGIPRTLG